MATLWIRAARQTLQLRPSPSGLNLATPHSPFTAETTELPCLQGFLERMKGLEPSTFCMASRRSSQLSYIRTRPQYSRGFSGL